MLVFVSLVFVLRFFKLIRGPEEDSVAAHAGEKAQEGGIVSLRSVWQSGARKQRSEHPKVPELR